MLLGWGTVKICKSQVSYVQMWHMGYWGMGYGWKSLELEDAAVACLRRPHGSISDGITYSVQFMTSETIGYHQSQ